MVLVALTSHSCLMSHACRCWKTSSGRAQRTAWRLTFSVRAARNDAGRVEAPAVCVAVVVFVVVEVVVVGGGGGGGGGGLVVVVVAAAVVAVTVVMVMVLVVMVVVVGGGGGGGGGLVMVVVVGGGGGGGGRSSSQWSQWCVGRPRRLLTRSVAQREALKSPRPQPSY